MSTTTSEPRTSAQHTRRQIIEWAVVIIAAFLAATVLRATVVQAFSIPSISMEKTLLVGDRVLVNKRNRSAHVGDIVVFKRPPGEEAQAIKDLIKRVIATEGQTVSVESGKVFVNGKQIDEPYLQPGIITDHLDSPITVPRGYIFVMGDNRPQSHDSRYFGPIAKSLIVGHAYFRVWPPSRIGGL